MTTFTYIHDTTIAQYHCMSTVFYNKTRIMHNKRQSISMKHASTKQILKFKQLTKPHCLQTLFWRQITYTNGSEGKLTDAPHLYDVGEITCKASYAVVNMQN